MLQDVGRFICNPEAVSLEFKEAQQTILTEVLHYCNCILRLMTRPELFLDFINGISADLPNAQTVKIEDLSSGLSSLQLETKPSSSQALSTPKRRHPSSADSSNTHPSVTQPSAPSPSFGASDLHGASKPRNSISGAKAVRITPELLKSKALVSFFHYKFGNFRNHAYCSLKVTCSN
jgi:hypothetical protein